jgi:hypothetical protein
LTFGSVWPLIPEIECQIQNHTRESYLLVSLWF